MKLIEIKQDTTSNKYLVELNEAEFKVLQSINDIRIFDKVEVFLGDKGRSWNVITTVKRKDVYKTVDK